MSRRTLWILATVCLLGGLAWYSAYLAANRIYQVDECQNIYMAKVLATGQSSEFFTNGSLFLLGPLSWLTKALQQSERIFASARLFFLGIFWLNLILVALIAGKRLRSVEGLIALAGVATLAPLWDYGFEVRHDNLVLTGILLIWWMARAHPMGLPSYAAAGAITVAMLFIAVKSVVYVLPLAAAIVIFPPPGHVRPRLQLALAWVCGAILGLLAIRICYGKTGGWNIYLSVFHGVAKFSAGADGSTRFSPWVVLSRLPGQIPLVLALSFAAIFAVVTELVRRGRAAFTWNGNLPEVLLVGGVLAGLFINPTPFPYNVLHLVPYLFLLVFSYGRSLWQEMQARPNLWPVVGGLVLFGHLVPFGISARRHLEYPNYRQKMLMNLAEALTRPGTDAVYDGIGMVPTRRSIHYNWYLHSLNIRNFVSGSVPRVCDMLSAQPAAVLIQSYRTDWLTQQDHDFIHSKYVPLADDFWVPGKVLPSGGGEFEIAHAGRYRISTLAGSDLSGVTSASEDRGDVAGKVDGVNLQGQIVELAAGMHRIETSADSQVAVVWMGPQLERVRQLRQGDHRFLFVNWY